MRSKSKPKSHNKKSSSRGIPRAVFERLVKEISQDIKADMQWQPEAIDALWESSERMIEARFQKAGDLARLCKVETVKPEHLLLAAPVVVPA